MFYYTYSNCLDVAKFDILHFPLGLDQMETPTKNLLLELSSKLDEDIRKNATVVTRNYQNAGAIECYEIEMRKSKHIIDEIDRVLAQHYGFTDEELDYIINYDIKYRMGLVGSTVEDGE